METRSPELRTEHGQAAKVSTRRETSREFEIYKISWGVVYIFNDVRKYYSKIYATLPGRGFGAAKGTQSTFVKVGIPERQLKDFPRSHAWGEG